MKESLKDIVIGKGLGNIKFGITGPELEKILGKPDEIEKYSYPESDEETTEVWHYDLLEVSISFDEEDDWRLTSISVSSPEFMLKGKQLIGLGREEVLEAIKKMGLGEMEFEDYTSEEDDYKLASIDDASLNLWFEDEILTEIQWGILWEDEYTPVWPE